MIEKIIEKTKNENKKVYIYAHKFPDGDAISSSCSIVEYLKNNGIDASFVVTNPVYSFSQIVGQISTSKSVDPNSISLIVDTNTLDYAENKMFLNSKPEDIYIIDHHMSSDKFPNIEDDLKVPADNVLRNPSASSTCEILVSEFEKKQISPKIANMLTLGLMSDTAKLKFLKPDTLKNLQILLQSGAKYDDIITVCTRKSNLRDEVGIAKLLLTSEKFDISDTFGIILPVDNKDVNSINLHYGLRAIQKKIFKMSDITNCSFNCVFAENTPGEFDLEFRSSSIYGNFDVQKLATTYGGGGHYNASGCHLSQKKGYNIESIYSTIHEYVSDNFLNQSSSLGDLTLSDTDKKLASILDETSRLTKNVTTEILSKVDTLRNQGANYDYIFKTFKTFEAFMLENEILSRVPDIALTKRNPYVNINLSQKDVDNLCQTYNVTEDDLLNAINVFSGINIQSASISLPNGRKISIDSNGDIFTRQPNPDFKKSNNIEK